MMHVKQPQLCLASSHGAFDQGLTLLKSYEMSIDEFYHLKLPVEKILCNNILDNHILHNNIMCVHKRLL